MFADLEAGVVLAATAEHWDVTGPLPQVKGDWLACPVCRSRLVQVRFWRFHERSGHPTTPYRCDVSFKCCACAAVWIHGVAIDEETWLRCKPRRTGVKIHHREGRKLLEEQEA